MTKMFKVNGKPMRTYNPFTGCRFECTCCWARRQAEGRLRRLAKYRNGFAPTFHPEELQKKFNPGEFIFVSDMGDISFAPYKDQLAILDRVSQFPDTRFFFQSKNPAILIQLGCYAKPNIYLGTTIETNRDYHITKAPPPAERCAEMRCLQHKHKFISIEPILDFDLEVLVRWMAWIQPEMVEIGADNHHCYLSEPGWEKVEALLATLEKFVPQVERKEGLERLKEKRPGGANNS
jgi:DNA repair photolyase